jgi:hypothetical protein
VKSVLATSKSYSTTSAEAAKSSVRTTETGEP